MRRRKPNWDRLPAVASAALIVMTLAVAQCANAQQNGISDRNGANSSGLAELTAKQEEVALAFAKQHHPELAQLLQQLKLSGSSGYVQALREVHQTAARVSRWQKKQPRRYEQELASWKLDSEIRLLVARWSMSQDPELESTIRQMLLARRENRIDRLRDEERRLQERLNSVHEQLAEAESQVEENLSAEWDRLAKRATAAQKANRPRKTETK